MLDLGWPEGKGVEYRVAFANGSVDRLDALAGEMFGQTVVVIPDGMYFAERVQLHELMQTARLPAAYALRDHVVGGGVAELRGRPAVELPQRGNMRGQDLESRQARGSPGGADDQVRVCDQPQDSEGARRPTAISCVAFLQARGCAA